MIDKVDPNKMAFEEPMDFQGEEEFANTFAKPSTSPKTMKKLMVVIVPVLIGLGAIQYYQRRQINQKNQALAALPSLLKPSQETPPVPKAFNEVPSPKPLKVTPEAAPTPPQQSKAKDGQDIHEIRALFAPEAGPTPIPSPASPIASKVPDKAKPELQAKHQDEQALLIDKQNKAINALIASVDNLNKNLKNQIDKTQRVEQSLGNLVNGFNKLNQDFASADIKVLGLANTVNALSNDVSNIKRSLSEDEFSLPQIPPLSDKQRSLPDSLYNSSNKQKETLSYQNPEYVVHAVIPGRAWLKSSSGKIVTVVEGDNLDDFGKVLVIDAANGIILMSSGLSFR